MGPKETENHFALTTERLKLRRPCVSDAARLAAIANDWAIASNLATMAHPYGISDANSFIERVRPVQMPAIVLFITTRTDDRLIGCCSLRPRDGDGAYEIGYWLGRASWGCGFATEAVHALVDFAFTAAGLQRLHVSCRVTNSSSRRVIHKCGFQPDGTDMTTSQALGGSVAVECYALDRAIWRGLRQWHREDGYVFS